ncbi:MAG: hypothetical protein JKY89_08195 [Immundisolibacteraceae bacterium]|nr:hypothetical protein [Immundisolibacteraceae bacterium]
MGIPNDTNINGQDSAVNNVSAANAVQERLLLTLSSMDCDGITVGPGYQHKCPPKATQYLLGLAEKKEAEKKKHNIFLKQIQADIQALKAQIKVLYAKIDVLNDKKNENKEKFDKNKERMAELKAQGKEDLPEYVALLAANNLLEDENNEIDAEIKVVEHDIDELEEKVKKLENRLENALTKAEQTQIVQQTSKLENGNEIVNIAVADATTVEARRSILVDKEYEEVDLANYNVGSKEEAVNVEMLQNAPLDESDLFDSLMAKTSLELAQDTSVSYAKSGIKVDSIVPSFENAAAPSSVASLEVSTVHTPDVSIPKGLETKAVDFGNLT